MQRIHSMDASTRTGNKRQAKDSADRSGRSTRSRISRTHKPEDIDLEQWQRLLRKQYGEQQDFHLENRGDHPVFSDFLLTNPQTQKTYKIAIRVMSRGTTSVPARTFRSTTWAPANISPLPSPG
jgi:hypothetical protein